MSILAADILVPVYGIYENLVVSSVGLKRFNLLGSSWFSRAGPWYVPNTILHTDLQIPTVKAEITNFSTKYREKLLTHPNEDLKYDANFVVSV